MAKKIEIKQWALWNLGRLMAVERTRRECREAANRLCPDGKPEADKMFRKGWFNTSKVIVREI